MRHAKLLTLLGPIAAGLPLTQAHASVVEDGMEQCRHGGDLEQKVTGCSTVINYSRDRKALLRAYNTRGLALCDLDRCAEAVTDFNHVVQIDSSIAGYFDNRARALRAAGRYPDAIADSERAIRMAPTYAFVYLGKAHALEDTQRLGDALAVIDQSLRVEPTNAGIWEYRGKVLGEMSRYAEAYNSYDRSLTIQPDRWNVYRTRADTELAQGRSAAALADLQRYPEDGAHASEVMEKIASIRSDQEAEVQRQAEQQRQAEVAQRAAVLLDHERQINAALQAERDRQAERERAEERQRQVDRDREAERQRQADRDRELERQKVAEQDRQRREADAERMRPQIVVQLVNPMAQAEKQVQAAAPATVQPVSTAPALSKEAADKLSRSLGELGAQVKALQGALDEQKRLKSASDGDVATIDETIVLVAQQLDKRQAELSQGQRQFSTYLTSIKPEDRQLYMTARAATQSFPRVPYYIPGTPETGEFWIEPVVTDAGALTYQFRFVDPQADYNKVRESIVMTPTELADTQAALTKVRAWSQKAHEAGLRKVYSKRAACFPQANCPADGDTIDGAPSTEIRFNVYEDGSTGGRIQRNKGRFVEGYNVSTDSALLLGAYIAYARRVADREFTQGKQTKQDLDKMFQ